jgi:hypothetical protein
MFGLLKGSMSFGGSVFWRMDIYAKGTKMANLTTKKNQHKNGNDVQDSPPPYCHIIAKVPYSCNHQNNKRP